MLASENPLSLAMVHRIKESISKLLSKLLLKRNLALIQVRELHLLRRMADNFKKLANSYEFLLQAGNPSIRIPELETRSALLARQRGTPPSEVYIILEALHGALAASSGDVCEFGVAQGEFSALLANEIRGFPEKRLHLFDSFAGLPKPGPQDRLKDDVLNLGTMDAYAGTMCNPENLVLERLNQIQFPDNRVTIHKGFFGDLLAEKRNFPRQVCFAYIDFDFYEPILQALEFVHSLTNTGSAVVVDDYDFFSTGAKLAVDEFVRAKNADKQVYEFTVPPTQLAHCAILKRIG